MIRRRLARALLPAALLALLATAPAAPAAGGARVAVDADGTAHLSWIRSGATKLHVVGRSRTAGGALSDAQYVSPLAHTTNEVQTAIGADGATLHLWTSFEPSGSRVRLRSRAADGTLGPVQDITPYGVGSVRIATDPSGGAVMAWHRTVGGKSVVEARRRSPGGVLGDIQRLSATAPTYGTHDVDVDVDAAGNAVATWLVIAPTPIVQVRRRAVNGTLSAIQNVTTSSAAAANPLIDVDPQGNAVLAFRRTRGDQSLVQARRRSAGGTLGAIEDVSPAYDVPPIARIAGDPAGGTTIAWFGLTGGRYSVRAVRRAPGGTYGEVADVSPANASVTGFRFGVDADGDATFVWRRTTDDGGQIQTRRRTAAGTLFPIVDLTPADADVTSFDIGVEASGGAYVTWTDTALNQVVGRRRTEGGELSAVQTLSY